MVTSSAEVGTVSVDQSAATFQSPLTEFSQLMAVMPSSLATKPVFCEAETLPN
jgi:hypothetical protein